MSVMCHKRLSARQPSAQRGFALVTAIFLLVVLAALGAFMVTMSVVQHATSAQDVQGSRAYQAARAGIEWSAYQIMNPENTNPAATPFKAQYNCANTPYTFAPGTTTALGGTLADVTVIVTCARTKYDEGDNRISMYQLSATATSGTVGGTYYVERQVSATLGTCRKTDDGESCNAN